MRNHLTVARQSVWVQIGGVILFAAGVALLVDLTHFEPTGIPLIAAGVVLAVVPAALWLWLFTNEDRFEPEPRQLVLGVFVLGALLAYSIGQPVVRGLFRVQDWLHTSPTIAILGSILIVGLVQQFLLHAAVRYSIFGSSEFDERIDGIIYGAAAGLGYATMVNILYVVENQGVNLAVGVMRVTVQALALGSFGGITGYFLARAKFDKMGPVWLPLGLAIAATLNGLVDFALDELPLIGGGFGFNWWYGLAGAVIVAGVTFTLLFELIQRLNRTGDAAPAPKSGSAFEPVLVGEGRLEEPEWIVWAVVAAGLVLGAWLSNAVLGETRSVTAGGMSLAYPARWIPRNELGADWTAIDVDHGGVFGPRVSLRQTTKAALFPSEGNIDDAAANWALTRQPDLPGFRLIDISGAAVQGRAAARVEYVYLLDSPQGSGAGVLPALMHSVDVIVSGGDKVYILTFAAETHAYDSLTGVFCQLLSNWRVP